MINHNSVFKGEFFCLQKNLHYQLGEGLLSFLIVLGVMVILAPVAFQYLQKSMDLDTAGAAAYHAIRISEARDHYVKDNYALILQNAATGPVTITTAMLKNAGYLDTSISDSNINNQTYQTRAIKVSEGGNDLLRVLTVTDEGRAFNENELRNIAAKTAKIGGGFISSSNASVAQGYRGSYQVSLADYGILSSAGHVALGGFFNAQGVLGDYLYRNSIPGHPELNRMNTTLNLGGNAISDVSTLTATGKVATDGDVQGRDLLASRDLLAARDIAANRNIVAAGDVSASTMTATNTISAANNITSGGTLSGAYLSPTTIAIEGSNCAPNGLIAKTSSGLILSCQSGVWKSQSMKLLGKDVQQGEVTTLMTYRNTNEDGLAMYCRAYNQTINSDSLLVLNGTTNAISEVSNYSELVVSFNLGGQQIAMNYQVATSTGGFTTSVSASETVRAGQVQIEICVQSRSVTDWTARYSISVLE